MENITIFFSSKSNVNTGKGGAYFSLIVYKKILSNAYNPKLIHLNALKHKTVIDEETDLFLSPLCSNIENYRKLKTYFKEVKPVVFISFSNHPLILYIRWLCFKNKCKFIYVKAGGPNYRLEQYFKNVIFFSKENYSFCEGSRYVKAFVISNRINPFVSNEKRLLDLQKTHSYPTDDVTKILRVSRLNNTYLPVFLATINLHKSLQDRGIPVMTHLIGYEEDKSITTAIKNAIGETEGITLYTDDYYTHNAKELIPLYDIIVGIGRGFWEGVACDKFTLGYANNADVPVLVTKTNVEIFKEYNFSTRVNLPEADTFIDNINIFTSISNRKNYVEFLKNEFDVNYSTTTLKQKLEKALNDSEYETLGLLIKSILFVIYTTVKLRIKDYFKSKNSVTVELNQSADKKKLKRLFFDDNR